ncbi:peptidoglycan-binding domain-containing protein [Kribbella albertanoniae]|uniref:Peptidoglycan-binding protein n=1 Tax=Kribbella albertanoniae TaxID=1266829 RepID=A0A4R4P4U2_9ACTN|nr:peptidoglycan-binding domain-containing protein [Kribbella albertanoniae]TDC15760.1 peptidoglycan-binding protein [Kribbella albertanoniae]
MSMRLLKSTIAVAALAVTPLVAAAAPASAAPLSQCDSATFKKVGSGWTVFVPGEWESTSTTCNLKYGDNPHRDPKNPFGDPTRAIQALQSNLNYCYGSKLAKDGRYGAKTRDAVKAVQKKLKLTADGVYGPQTRSAMKWRMYNPTTKTWSQGCYDKL